MTKSPLDLYTQCLFLDPFLLDFSSYYAFRNRYAEMRTANFGGRSIQIVAGYKNLPELAKTLKPFSYRILKDDCLDLPPKTFMKRVIQLTPEQKKVYAQMKSMALAEMNGKMITTVNVITQLMRLQQITCGHFKADDGSFQEIKNKWSNLDFVVHAIAFSDRAELSGEYLKTSRDNFIKSMVISCFSFTEVAKEASKIMEKGGSLLTLTYFGSEKVMPHYNVMGIAKAALETSIKYLAKDLGQKNIRVNGLSPGPIKTLAASAIGDFNYILKWNEQNSPLKRNITSEEIAGSALYLLSDLANGVTGEIHHVDSGYNIIGMKNSDSPDIFENK